MSSESHTQPLSCLLLAIAVLFTVACSNDRSTRVEIDDDRINRCVTKQKGCDLLSEAEVEIAEYKLNKRHENLLHAQNILHYNHEQQMGLIGGTGRPEMKHDPMTGKSYSGWNFDPNAE